MIQFTFCHRRQRGPSSKWYRRAKRWSALIFKRDLISPFCCFVMNDFSIRFGISRFVDRKFARARFTTTRRRLSWSWCETIKMFELRIESYFFFIRHVRLARHLSHNEPLLLAFFPPPPWQQYNLNNFPLYFRSLSPFSNCVFHYDRSRSVTPQSTGTPPQTIQPNNLMNNPNISSINSLLSAASHLTNNGNGSNNSQQNELPVPQLNYSEMMRSLAAKYNNSNE